MDYSMLLGIEENILFGPLGKTKLVSDEEEEKYFDDRHRFLSSDRSFIYHISIIDYLQFFNRDKKFENFAKTLISGTSAEISAVNPTRYKARYDKFMEEEVIIDDTLRKNATSKYL